MYKCKYSFRWFVHKDPYLVTKYPIWFEQDVSYWAEVIVFILHYEFAFELRFLLEKIAFIYDLLTTNKRFLRKIKSM